MSSTAPILFLIFNRPNYTQAVFERIRKARPKQLYVAADGPRAWIESDHDLSEQARAIVNDVDWDCELQTLFRKENLGCGQAIREAITWFFQHCEAGIILEDDCLPTMQFFNFASGMLEEYKQDQNVFHVAGYSWVQDSRFDYPYYFMRYPNIWGWATWRDRWAKYDFDLLPSKEELRGIFGDLGVSAEERYYHRFTFENVRRSLVDTWDYQWKFCVMKHRGLCITPNGSLVDNIGVESSRTEARSEQDRTVRLLKYEDVFTKRSVSIDFEMEKLHRKEYLFPKARYFYTLNSFKQKVKDFLIKNRGLHTLFQRLLKVS